MTPVTAGIGRLVGFNLPLFKDFWCTLQAITNVHQPRRTRLRTLIANLIRNESGVTAIEYALIAALIAVAAIGAMQLVGTGLQNTFSSISNQL
ncbi:MAG: Flp family type IVb pilin [Stellaceae bacterium]